MKSPWFRTVFFSFSVIIHISKCFLLKWTWLSRRSRSQNKLSEAMEEPSRKDCKCMSVECKHINFNEIWSQMKPLIRWKSIFSTILDLSNTNVLLLMPPRPKANAGWLLMAMLREAYSFMFYSWVPPLSGQWPQLKVFCTLPLS